MPDTTPAVLTVFDKPVTAMVVGASRGIGAGFASMLAASSNIERIICAARDPAASSAITALRAQHGERIAPLSLDVTDEDAVRAAAAVVGELTDSLALIITTVGVLHTEHGMQPERRLRDITPCNLMDSYRVNCIGPLLIAKHFERLLPKRDTCVVATLSARVGSIADNGMGGWYAYRASKAAQNMMTRNLAIELQRGHKGIRCIALHPGTVDTGLSEPFQANVDAGQLFSVTQSVAHLTKVLNGLGDEDNGRFFAWDGQEIPW